MNNKKMDIDRYTKDLVNKTDIVNPSKDFTKNVMTKILKDPSIKVSFITDDDKKSNLWLMLSLSIMIIGFFLFYFIKFGFNFSEASNGFETPVYIKAIMELFSEFWSELSFSPYILIALVGVIFLVVIDKTIVKYLYSI